MPNINFEDMPEPKDFDFVHLGNEYHAEWDGEFYAVTWDDMSDLRPAHYTREQVDKYLKDGGWELAATYTKKDPIKPDHYHKGGIDVIGFSEKQFSQDELKGFCRINCLKYITRYDRKGGLTDLKKADFYLGKLMEMEEAE